LGDGPSSSRFSARTAWWKIGRPEDGAVAADFERDLDEHLEGERRDVSALGLHDCCCFKELDCLPTFKQEMTMTEISPLRQR